MRATGLSTAEHLDGGCKTAYLCIQTAKIPAMPEMVFNSLNDAKRLEQAGFTRVQAEVQANIMTEIVDEKIATKQDLRDLELRLTYDLTLRMGAMITAGVAFLAALMTFLK